MNPTIEKLRMAKKRSGLTLKQISQKSGISQGTVNKIMSGEVATVKAEVLTRLADALGISASSFVCNNDVPDVSPFYGYVNVATISPDVKVGDCKYNADQIIAHARTAYQNKVNFAVFPELCVTSYSCEDLFFQHALRTSCNNEINRIINETAEMDMVIIIGAPLCDLSGRMYNVAIVIHRGKVLGVVPKTHLPNYNEFCEKRFFSPAPENNGTIEVCGQVAPFGTNIVFVNSLHSEVTFAVEVCEDIWNAVPPSCSHTMAGANMIFNLSASDETVTKSDYRRQLVAMQSAKTTCAYAYCSAGMGESTDDVVFSAHNIIAENGVILDESAPFGKGYAQAYVDCNFIANERVRACKVLDNSNYLIVNYSQTLSHTVNRKYESTPFVPTDKKQLTKRCETIFNIQSYALYKRIKHVNASKLVIGVSGGSDSTLALIACSKALKLLNRSNSDIVAVTMPCFGTTKKTLDNSVALAKAYGCTVQKIDITKAVTQHLQDIAHPLDVYDVTYENAQARERTQVLMDVANQTNGLVIGTGDLSELALGWATYNGDHMSMYSVNCGVPKTAVKALIRYEADNSDQVIKQILYSVLDTPVSPELIPPKNGQIVQITEDVVGPYELHDFFLYHMIRNGFAPSKTYLLSQLAFKGKYDNATIFKWLSKFIWRFFSQQFKRACVPCGVKIGSVALSPRGDWRMPSDACADSWIADLERVRNEVAK